MLAAVMRISENSWLIADIGATNSRCAILSGQSITRVKIFRNDAATSLEALLTEYLAESGATPRGCALAVAAPVAGDTIQMINRDWRFSRESLLALAFEQVEIINDFHAIAWLLPHIGEGERDAIGSATVAASGNIAVLGPGSGLGMSAWIDDCAAMCGEGGHLTLAAQNADEERIIAVLRKRYGHCSAERVLSGPGLIALHNAMHGSEVTSSEQITVKPNDAQAAATLAQFFLFLGSVAAELALITGALGGVYIAGGIVPACAEALRESGFRARFEDKGRYRDYMRRIPTWVLTEPQPGLRGIAYYLAQHNNALASGASG